MMNRHQRNLNRHDWPVSFFFCGWWVPLEHHHHVRSSLISWWVMVMMKLQTFHVLFSLVGASWRWMWKLLPLSSCGPSEEEWWWWWDKQKRKAERFAHLPVFSAWWRTLWVEVECQKNNLSVLEGSFSGNKWHAYKKNYSDEISKSSVGNKSMQTLQETRDKFVSIGQWWRSI